MPEFKITFDVIFSADDSESAYAMADRWAGSMSDENTHVVTHMLQDMKETCHYFRADDPVLPMPMSPAEERAHRAAGTLPADYDAAYGNNC